MTNGDRIRQMKNEELAKILSCTTCIYNGNVFECHFNCKEGIKAYLDMEAKE